MQINYANVYGLGRINTNKIKKCIIILKCYNVLYNTYIV